MNMKIRIAAIILLLPHIALLLLTCTNLGFDLFVLDFSGERTLNLALDGIILGGEILTCLALWKPGKFSALGPLARVRIAALLWNFINSAWLGWLVSSKYGLDKLQIAEMLLAFTTAAALMVFAVEEKKP